MANGRKLLLGILVTLLLAVLAHGPFNMGARFVDLLGTNAKAAGQKLQGGAGLIVQNTTGSPLSRTVSIANGPKDANLRDEIGRAILNATPGAARIHWLDSPSVGPTTIVADSGKKPSAEQVTSCQAQVSAALSGKSIKFVSGGAALADDAPAVIDGVAAALGPCADMQVEVAGHTDATGGAARNQRLSEERANNVVAALVSKGVPTARLQPRGYGESRPLDKGTSDAALATNRRIEFSVAARN